MADSKILQLSYAGLTVRSQQETADIMGITKQRVSFIERSALSKLHRALLKFKADIRGNDYV